MADQPPVTVPSSRVSLAVGTIGFALGGFFDGILLHQVLQWHHFLSLVPGEALRDIGAQILADGLFHVAVYAIAALGLWLLWRARGGLAAADGRRLLGVALLGFGVWQAVDVAGFHWVAGIHRIRVDVPNPLLWDLGWLAVFGLPTLVLGVWLLRSPAKPDRPLHNASFKAAASLSFLVISSGMLSIYPAWDAATAVFFKSGIGAAAAFEAAAAVDARLVWSAPDGEVMIIKMPAGSSSVQLYRMGAFLVTSTSWMGCIGRNPA